MKLFVFALIALFSLCTAGISAGNAAAPTEPVIESIRGKIVRVRVPSGFDRITLQQRVVGRGTHRAAGRVTWRTIATRYPRGAEAVVKIKLRSLVGVRQLRVFGNKLDPLPGSLLTGITRFLPENPAAATESAAVNSNLRAGTMDASGTVTATNFSADTVSNGTAESNARTVSESDIWKVDGNRLYYYNSLRGLQAFDLAKPEAPALLGTLRLPGSGEEMYLLGRTHAVLLKDGPNFWPIVYWDTPTPLVASNVAAIDITTGVAGNGAASSIAVAPRQLAQQQSEIIIAAVRGGPPRTVASLPVEGSIAESRLVGDVLYVASSVSRLATDTAPAEYGLQVTSFDLADPEHPVQRDAVYLGGWANAVSATQSYFMVAKWGDSDGDRVTNTIDLVDISAPDGTMKRAGQAVVQGSIESKFHMHIDGDVLTAVAQDWGYSDNPHDDIDEPVYTSVTKLQTFSLADPDAPAPLASIDIAPGEWVRATRFDADRAYVVTFERIDPLFVVDLRDPANPRIAGHVEAPGFSTYIEPLGDRLVTIGLVNWRPAVSLFDVSKPSHPKLLSQLKLGGDKDWSHSEAVWDEKAFKVLPEDNLILLPVSGSNAEEGWFSRVQLIDLLPDSLVERGRIAGQFSPRRATLVGKSIAAISPSRLVTVDAADRDEPRLLADLEIAWRVDRVFLAGRYLVQIGGSADWSAASPPTLSVSSAVEPNDLLNTIELPNRPVIGATVQDDVLYLAQGQGGWPSFDQNGEIVDDPERLVSSAYDLSALPALRLLGKASARTQLSYGELSAHWPSPGILVWAAREERGYYFEPSGAAMLSDHLLWRGGYFSMGAARLYAFDFTRLAAPVAVSNVFVGDEQPWDVSAPFAANGALYLSYRYLGDPTTEADENADDSRLNRHYLVRVDYSDPSAPVIEDTQVNLPGELRSVARAGQLLFTVGQDQAPDATGSALHASAFDGTAAHLLDSLPLHSRWDPLVIAGDRIFTLEVQPAQLWVRNDPVPEAPEKRAMIADRIWWGWGTWKANEKKSILAAWALDDTVHFAKLDSVEAEHDSSLFAYGDLLVTQSYDRELRLFDFSDRTNLRTIGEFGFDGWVWPDLSRAAGDLARGLWAPVGVYGVEFVPFIEATGAN